MANFGTAKTFFSKSPQVVVESATETWTVVTVSTTEVAHTLQTDAVQVEVINQDHYNGSTLTDRARVAIIANETANDGDYISLSAGGKVIIDVGANTAIYCRGEVGGGVRILFRERRI